MSTTSEQPLGRLQPVDLRTIWVSEPAGFTPWLADEENLAVLSETLRLDLELVTVEKEVGPFRADIVCKDIGMEDEALVLIENQLEKTDHKHLGQLLTYAAGLQAISIVWLAEKFSEEHRAALDWLNKITHKNTRFFGVEIELWRIDDSLVAPKFNPVSMPNDWSRSFADRVTGGTELSERRLVRKEYWTGLQDRLDAAGGPVRGNRAPGHHSWQTYPIGRRHFNIVATINMRDKFIRAELYIRGNDASEYHGLLEQQKDEIEQELGYQLEWGDQQPSSRDHRISYYLRNSDPRNKQDWPRQHEWLVEHLNKLHQVFVQRVRGL
ncbi:MAG: DUF4268 domain-containing protein [Proteobacteria bacterium]|nr:DUF4268 domain-containing protein [Pseudomonadota bacterium]